MVQALPTRKGHIMTVSEVQAYYGHDWREFVKRAGFSRRTWFNWQAGGSVPMDAQLRLQRKTRGRLKADPKHVGGGV